MRRSSIVAAPLRWICSAFVAAVLLSLGPRARAADSAKSIELDVDFGDPSRRIVHSHMKIPAAPGAMKLVYPNWIPGEHGPVGPINDVVGVKIKAGGKELPWRRDNIDMFQYQFEVPKGETHIEVWLDFLTAPPETEGFTQGASMTPYLAMLSWNQCLLYPAGARAAELEFAASLRLPDGWKFATALRTRSEAGGRAEFIPVSLDQLVDSPVLCGKFFREISLDSSNQPPHFLEIAADSDEALGLSAENIAKCGRLVVEAGNLFGARPYDSYRFLISTSDHVAHFGLEHHECSDDRISERSLIESDIFSASTGGLLAHEYVHSWNGKYRRPAGLATPDFQQPMDTALLWVYEGLTEYLGMVLWGRSGIASPEETREEWALVAQFAKNHHGRDWRPLGDTAVAAQRLYDAGQGWSSLRRGVDFYKEGALLWLEVDTILREQTHGARSIDDFCRSFHGGQNGRPNVKTYEFDDVVKALDSVAHYDWNSHLRRRLEAVDPNPPLGGLERAGWRLAYGAEPTKTQKVFEKKSKSSDLSASIGLWLDEKGVILDVVPGEAADKAGLAPQMKLVAVNGRRWSSDILSAALGATKTPGAPLELIVENGEFYRTYRLDYHNGPRFAKLERDPSKPDMLSEIHKSRAKSDR